MSSRPSAAESRWPHRRWAFFGGSFDPPHLGHLAVARAARTALRLDTVLFAPVGAQPLKAGGAAASFADRVAMTRLAIADEPGFALSLVDAPQPDGAPNYTLATLLKLRAELSIRPSNLVAASHSSRTERGMNGAQDMCDLSPIPHNELFFLMGADSFASLKHWRQGAAIPFAAALIVASRPGARLDDLQAALPAGVMIDAPPDAPPDATIQRYQLRNPAGDRANFYLLPWLEVEISATEIRERIRRQISQSGEGKSREGEFLPAPVSDYIRAHGLYQ